MKATIVRLQNKLERLVSKHHEIKSVINSLKKIIEFAGTFEKEQQCVLELNEKNKILKLSVSLQGDEQDTQAAKQRINELCGIDKCMRC